MNRSGLFLAAGLIAGATLTAQFSQAADSTPTHYTVEAADSWQSIAQAHGVSADALQVANNLRADTSNSSHPRTGWILHVPQAPAPTTSTSSTAPTTTGPAPTTTVAPTTAPTTSSPAPSTTSTTVAPSSTTAPPSSTTSTTQPPAVACSTPGVQFCDTFADAGEMNRYDWQLFNGGTFTNDDPNTISDAPKSWWGDHDDMCSPPPTEGEAGKRRVVHAHAGTPAGPFETLGGLVFHCAPNGPESAHFMTAIDSVGYTAVGWSPKPALSNVHQVCWDMSLNDVAGWWMQLSVIPLAQFQANGSRLNYQSKDLGSEVAFNAAQITGDAFMFESNHGSTIAITGTRTYDPNHLSTDHIDGFPHHDRAKRYKHCVSDNENGTIRVDLYGRRSATDHEVRTLQGAMPNGPVKVIFEHSGYHPQKDTSRYHTLDGMADEMTVHWDNVEIY